MKKTILLLVLLFTLVSCEFIPVVDIDQPIKITEKINDSTYKAEYKYDGKVFNMQVHTKKQKFNLGPKKTDKIHLK